MNRNRMLINGALTVTAAGLILAMQPGVAYAGLFRQPVAGALLPLNENVPLFVALLVLVACLVCAGLVGLRRTARRPPTGPNAERKAGRDR